MSDLWCTASLAAGYGMGWAQGAQWRSLADHCEWRGEAPSMPHTDAMYHAQAMRPTHDELTLQLPCYQR